MPKSNFVFVVYEVQKYKTGKNSWGRTKAVTKSSFKLCSSFSTKEKAEEFAQEKKEEYYEKLDEWVEKRKNQHMLEISVWFVLSKDALFLVVGFLKYNNCFFLS
jgi:hypothetical protein